jgi:hypothetical protein
MKKTLVALLLVITFQAYGQDNRLMFGFNTSIDWNSYFLVKDVGISNLQGTLNYASGIMVRKYFSKHGSLSGSVNYATRNFKERLEYSKFELHQPTDPAFANDPVYTYKHTFIDIPIDYSYRIFNTGKLEMLPSAGLVNSVLIHYKQEGGPINEVVQRETMKYNRHLMAIKLGFAFLIKKENFGILFETQTRTYVTGVYDRGGSENPLHLGFGASFLWWK